MSAPRGLKTLAAAAFAIALVAATAPASAATPEQAALAREVVLVSGDGDNINQMVPIFLDEAKRTFVRTQPDLAKDLDASIKAVQPEFDKRRDALIGQIAELYAGRFSTQELQDLKTFFTSPSGKKYIETRPVILNAAYEAVNAWSRQMTQDVITRLREEMKKRGHDL